MKVPVATKMSKRELAKKNSASGPRSRASLRSGLSCGFAACVLAACAFALWVSVMRVVFSAEIRSAQPCRSVDVVAGLDPAIPIHLGTPREKSIGMTGTSPVMTPHESRSLGARNRPGEITRRERRQIVDAFTDADEMHRHFELRRDGDQNAAARGAVEFGHDQPGDADHLAENLHLRQRILPHGG